MWPRTACYNLVGRALEAHDLYTRCKRYTDKNSSSFSNKLLEQDRSETLIWVFYYVIQASLQLGLERGTCSQELLCQHLTAECGVKSLNRGARVTLMNSSPRPPMIIYI